MKKILLFCAATIAFSCSTSDDDEKNTCENKVWNITQNGDTYLATYGTTQASAGTITVNETTYEYYTALGNVNDGSLCWQGTKD